MSVEYAIFLSGMILFIPAWFVLKGFIPRQKRWLSFPREKRVGGHTRDLFYAMCLLGWQNTHTEQLVWKHRNDTHLFSAFVFGLGIRKRALDLESMNTEFEIFWQEISSR